MMILFYLWVLSLTEALPSCCFDSTHYNNFLSSFPCNLTCTFQEVESDVCISCQSRSLKIKDNFEFINDLSFTKPVTICQDFLYEKDKIFGRIVLSWSFKIASTAIFIVDVRTSSTDEWDFVGMTNESVAFIKHLDISCKYQFRVTPLIMPNITLPSLTSDWIFIAGKNTSVSMPSNVTVTDFSVIEDFVEAKLNWITSNDVPCSYILYWLPSTGGDFFGQKNIILPNDTLPIVISGLSFQTNYTIKLSPVDPSRSRKINATETWFVTPSCLILTTGNFTLCAPGPPLNLTSILVAESEVLLRWLPPKYTSPENELTNYHLSVIEASERYHAILRYRDKLILDKNTLNFTVSFLKPSVSYIFEVRADSVAGRGRPAVTQLYVRESTLIFKPIDYVPWHYIVPTLTGSIIFLLLAVFLHFMKIRGRIYKHKGGYPSGTADVLDHIRPFLLSSQKISLLDVVGQGEFGTVYKGIFMRKKFKEIVAVKVFPAESISREKLLHEVEILEMVGRHQHIVGLIGFTLDIDKMYLVLEYCDLGNLHAWLRKLKKELSVIKRQLSDPKQLLIKTSSGKEEHYGVKLCSYIYQIALGMEYISSLRMIHRDLAARNILLYSETQVKIADFGLSEDIYETQTYTISTQKKLPLRWMAPEAIENHKFTVHTDVWSFGVLIWEIFKFGKVPYSSLSNCAILPFLKSGYRLPKPKSTSQCWYDIMLDCWHVNPHKRPTFKELVKRAEEILTRLCQYTVVMDN